MKKFWENVEIVLKTKGIPKGKFAKEISITPPHLSMLIKGKRGTTTAMMEKVASFLGLKVIDLLNDDIKVILTLEHTNPSKQKQRLNQLLEIYSSLSETDQKQLVKAAKIIWGKRGIR